MTRSTHLESTHKCVIHRHHGPCVVEFSTIVWRAEQGDQLALCKKLVPVFNNLQYMRDFGTLELNIFQRECPRLAMRNCPKSKTGEVENLSQKMSDLVSSANEIKIMFVQKLLHNIWPKREGHSAIIVSPARDVFVGI